MKTEKKCDVRLMLTDGETMNFEGVYYSQNKWAVVFRKGKTTRMFRKENVYDMEITEVSEEKENDE